MFKVEAVWQVLGNLALFCGGLILVALCLGLKEAKRTAHGRGEAMAWTLIYGLLPFTGLVWFGWLVSIGLGGFDWVALGRRGQYVWGSAAFFGWMLTAFFSGLGLVEKPSQLPWAVRPLAGWGLFLVLPACLVIGGLALNQPAGIWPPSGFVKRLLELWGGSGIGLGLGLLAEWAGRRSQHAAMRQRALAERQVQRDAGILESLQNLEPERDFPTLLGYCNRFEDEPIRMLAERKARAHPEFLSALQNALTQGSVEAGLIFLDGVSVSPAEQQALRPCLPKAVRNLGAVITRLINSQEYLYPEIFDFKFRVLLATLEKCGPVEPPTIEAVRELRALLELGRAREAKLSGRRILDQWLKASRP